MSHAKTINTIRDLGETIGGSHAERIAMLVLVSSDVDMKMTDIGNAIGLSRAAITSLVDRLELNGFVKREPHQTDRRVMNIVATKQGRAAVEAVA